MTQAFLLRDGRPGDGPAAFALFQSAVLEGAASHYSLPERTAWARGEPTAAWERRLLAGRCIVAETSAGMPPEMAGFFTLGDDGYLDFAYVAPRFIGQGLGRCLYAAIEAHAIACGMPVLSSEASHLARPLLERCGWTVEARQSVIRHGVPITNFRMHKQLGGHVQRFS